MERRDLLLIAWGAVFVLLDLRLGRIDLIPDLVGAVLITIAAIQSQEPGLRAVPPLVLLAALGSMVTIMVWPPTGLARATLSAGTLMELVVILLLGRVLGGLGAAGPRLRKAGYVAVATGMMAIAVAWIFGSRAGSPATWAVSVLAVVGFVAAVVWIVSAFQLAAEKADHPMPPLPGPS